MARYWLLAAAAGLGSAAVFMGGHSASLAGMVVAYLAPAPLFLCGLMLGVPAAVAAGGTGAALALLVLGPLAGLGYVLSNAVPVAVLTRQALLSRTAEDGSAEWYPPGLLASWLTGLGMAGLGAMAIPLMSGDAGLEGAVRVFTAEVAALVEAPEPQLFVDVVTPLLPGLVVAVWMLMLAANAALAQAGAVAMKRNLRPTPDIGAIELPIWPAVVGAVAAVAGLTLGGDAGYFLRNLAAVAAVPFLLQGLAVVHVLNRRMGGGTAMLAVFYTMLVVLSWVALPIVLLGLAEQVAGIRRRIMRRASPDMDE